MIFHCHIENGKLSIDTPEKWKRYLLGFDEGTKLVIDIDKQKNVRSLSQNKYYWLYLSVIADETGHTEEELHELFKRKFLPPTHKTVLGTGFKLPASTTDLSKHDFSEYLERICAMTGVPIPDPALAGYESNHQQYLTTKPVTYPSETLQEPSF